MSLLIGHFEKYHNTLCLSPQILHKHCFQFLLGMTKAPRENKNNAYAKFGGTNKEYYGIFRSGLLALLLQASSQRTLGRFSPLRFVCLSQQRTGTTQDSLGNRLPWPQKYL